MLTHCGLEMPYIATYTWVTIASDNGLLPDGTKPLPEPMLTLISEVLWHSLESNFTVSVEATILHNEFENHTFEITATPPRGPTS